MISKAFAVCLLFALAACSDEPASAPVTITVDCQRVAQADGTFTIDCGNNGNENTTIYGSGNTASDAGSPAHVTKSPCQIPQTIPCSASICQQQDDVCELPGVCPSGYAVALSSPKLQQNCLRTLMSACGFEVHCCPTQFCPEIVPCTSDDNAWWECPGAECVPALCEAGHCALGNYTKCNGP